MVLNFTANIILFLLALCSIEECVSNINVNVMLR